MVGTFIVSIDLELLWGFKGQKLPWNIVEIVKKSPEIIENLIRLSEKYEIPMTWAVVGKALVDRYSSSPLLSAKNAIYEILKSSINHEIASHSFSHIEFTKLNMWEARYELRKSREIIYKVTGHYPITFIYPRSKIAYQYLLKREGYYAYRIPPLGTFHKGLKGKPIRFISKLFPSKLILVNSFEENGLCVVPYSMLFQQNDIFKAKILSSIAIKGLHAAIKKSRIFHVVLHDYSLFNKAMICSFEYLLQEVYKEKQTDSLVALTIGELTKNAKE